MSSYNDNDIFCYIQNGLVGSLLIRSANIISKEHIDLLLKNINLEDAPMILIKSIQKFNSKQINYLLSRPLKPKDIRDIFEFTKQTFTKNHIKLFDEMIVSNCICNNDIDCIFDSFVSYAERKNLPSFYNSMISFY